MPCGVGGGYPPELAWWTGGRPRALIQGRVGLVGKGHPWWTGGQGGGQGGVQGLRFRGGSGRGANFATCHFFVVAKRRKMAVFEGCPVRWGSWPGGRGQTKGLDSRGRLGGYPPQLAWWTGGQGGGARARGVQGLRFGGVGGRDTGPRDGANFCCF